MVKNSGENNINHIQINETSVKLNLMVNTGDNYPFADGTALISNFRFAVLFAWLCQDKDGPANRAWDTMLCMKKLPKFDVYQSSG